MNRTNTRSKAPIMATYRASMRYRLLAMGALLMTLLFAWELWQLAEEQSTTDGALWGALFFFGVSLCILLWSGNAALTRIEITRSGLIRHTLVDTVWSGIALSGVQLDMIDKLMGEPASVEFRQLVSVTESGRGSGTITLLYHPRREDGLLDVYDAHSLSLPAMENQDDLVEQLEGRIPT